MISIRDYAKSHGVSYEAVRQQVSRYINREVNGFLLADHVTKVDRVQYLDEEAVAFLDNRRARNPIVIQQEERDETVERLRAEVDLLQKRLIAAQDEYRTLLQEKHEVEMREQGLLADKRRIEEFKASVREAEERADQAEQKAAQSADREKTALEAKTVAEEETAAARRDLDRIVADAKVAAETAAAEIERLREESATAMAAAEEAKEKAARMESAGILARIFRSW